MYAFIKLNNRWDPFPNKIHLSLDRTFRETVLWSSENQHLNPARLKESEQPRNADTAFSILQHVTFNVVRNQFRSVCAQIQIKGTQKRLLDWRQVNVQHISSLAFNLRQHVMLL